MLEAFKYYCKNKNIQIKNLDYSDVIVCDIDVEEEKKEELLRDIEQKKLNVILLKELRRKLVNI
jgi:hypothetical protein